MIISGSRFIRWASLVLALGWVVIATAPAIRASVPPPRVAPPSDARRGAVFGIIETDSTGKPFFVRTDSVPNVEGQEYGWFIGVGESTVAVRWTETLTLPEPASSWSDEGSSVPSNVSITPDHRTAVVRGEAVPEFGVIYNFWIVAPGDPSGYYTIVVKIDGGREERFDFAVGPPGSQTGRTQNLPTGAKALERSGPGVGRPTSPEHSQQTTA